MKRLVLLDAHAILHRAYHALPDFSTSKGEPTGALYGLSAMLIKIIEDLKPDYLMACYDLKGPTYRHELFKEYKAGRKKAEDDLVLQMKRSRDIFNSLNIPIYDMQGFEADDILGTIVTILQEKIEKGQIEIIIASGDMDTMQLIKDEKIKVYTLKKGINDTVIYDEKAIVKRFGFTPEQIIDYKGLRGDPSDNIPGIKGIGEKTATVLIKEFGNIENIYKSLEKGEEERFKGIGITPRIINLIKENKEEAEFSKVLSTIRRDVPISFQLPEKTFSEDIDVEKANQLWRELEFRTLGERLKKVLSVYGFKEEKKEQEETIDQLDLQKTFIALSLINSNLTNPELEDVYSFANTHNYKEAKEYIFKELSERNLQELYKEIELPLLPIIARMEERGVKIDHNLLQELSKDYHKELNLLEKKIWEFAGTEFNINSPKQLGEILFDKLNISIKNQKKTSSGARSTKESELEKMRDLHPIIPLIFEYRELAKLLGTYIDAIPPLLDHNDRLHTKFMQNGTTTGRLSSKDPNLQNIPVKTKLGHAIRRAFIAENGYKLLALDYSQIELRIAAFLSKDPKMMQIFKNNEDIHTSVAAFVFGVPHNEVSTEMRRKAKVINFGIIYGMGVLALKQNLGTTREEAQNFLNDYFETFKILAEYLEKVKKEAKEKGFTETIFGRRRYFEGISSSIPYIRAQAERMAINAPIQGTEADIVKLAMVRVFDYLQKKGLSEKVFPLLQVHDELIFEVKEEDVEQVSLKIKGIMENILTPEQTLGIPLSVSLSIGNNWGELK